ncbi:MAG: hypothetical protein E6J62_02690 [Deltaproteobacteria bacterium]|nr:MAG: hypothetical protein E6J62_02690 [Deltaproteobacteria bacterium]
MLAILFCASLGAAQPAPRTAKPASPSAAPAGPGTEPAPPSAPEVSADGIAVAGADAGASRIPSAPDAWGGVRSGSEPTLSDRVANYQLEAVLDPRKHTVTGKERLTWRNRSAVPVRSLYIHLYLNAFEGRGSTFYVEMAGSRSPGSSSIPTADPRPTGRWRASISPTPSLRADRP